VEQAIREDSGGGEEEADGLIAMEEAALGFAAGLALLLDVVWDEFVVHAFLADGLVAVYRMAESCISSRVEVRRVEPWGECIIDFKRFAALRGLNDAY
jgi:hypothetical protein